VSFRTILQWVAPAVVTLAGLAWIFSRIGLQSVADRLSVDSLSLLIPTLVVFCAGSLWIEAECLVRLLPGSRDVFQLSTASRIKAASYPLALLHYAIGMAGLSILLSRRTGHTIAEATGVVALITLFDIGIQLVLMVAGITALGTQGPAAQIGVATLVVAAIILGFIGLRTTISLGPLDRIRKLAIFDAARSTPLRLLAELAAFRFVFALFFVALIGLSCRAFGIEVPWTYLLATVPVLIVVAIIPSIAGLGTGQIAFVELFGQYGDGATLLACSLALSTGLLVMRASIGLLFAREFTREALAATRATEP